MNLCPEIKLQYQKKQCHSFAFLNEKIEQISLSFDFCQALFNVYPSEGTMNEFYR